ncbi:MAG: AraC family transcriptional regulator [Alphaproteobacteria bacterium]|nr:AraC family transcriptional regulator [Alphaproteobacteria bacterium]
MIPFLPGAEPMIRASVLHPLHDYLDETDVAADKLLLSVGLQPTVMQNPLTFIRFQAAAEFFERAAAALGEGCLGIRLAAVMSSGATGVLGQLIKTAPTGRDALRAFAGYAPIFSTDSYCGYREDSRSGMSQLQWRLPDRIAPRMQFNIFTGAAILQRLRHAMGETWVPTRIDFEHREPFGCRKCGASGCDECEDLKARILGNRAYYNQPANRIVHKTGALAQKMTTSDAVGWALHLDYAKRAMTEMSSQLEIVDRVRAEIAAGLKSQRADLPTIAGVLKLTPRGLQHQLNQAGTNFEAVLSATRARIASRLLLETDMPVTAISFDLGYSDPSVFTRAAKRWFEETPRQFRQRHRSSAAHKQLT